MLLLNPFSKIQNISENDLFIEADLKLIAEDTIELCFQWQDKKNHIVFADAPIGERAFKLWEQTCFEAFIQPVGNDRYFEINLTSNKSWNVFEFNGYRDPNPPQEFKKADLLRFTQKKNQLIVQIKLEGESLKKIKSSLCAVVILKDNPVSYWSTKHADPKPNFHHFESFIIERNAP